MLDLLNLVLTCQHKHYRDHTENEAGFYNKSISVFDAVASCDSVLLYALLVSNAHYVIPCLLWLLPMTS